MIRTEKSYIDGTSVRKIEYDVYEHNQVLKAKSKARANTKVKIKILFCIFMVFSAFALLMYRYALITDINYKLNKAYKEYENIKNENIRATVEIAKGMDLERIRQIAETELGMRKPEKHQIVRLNVTRNDYIQVAENIEQKNKKTNTFFSFLLTRLENLVRWLY
ncbi:MAG TPA: cell division protein FtsL [Clostridiaceae bacterium]|nr:cell division protein FtsL [Clostridiaceae bacterium]